MQDEDKPIDRDAWRRLLQPGAGEPPRATDERIRAGARRALTPHTGRWWLPASLAASLLLAVLLVQWQYEEIRAPALVSESDVAPEPSREAAPAAMPAEALESAAEASTRTAPAAARRPAVAAPAYQAPAPAADLPAMRKAAEAPTPAADAAITAGVAQRDELRAREVVAGEPATPEEWLARIEALRAAGRVEEAEAELKRLETAFPGWLERHHGESR
ncbi:MAG: hypothetical protein KF822_11100 [Steroidobacteraceae bacterium]|nr:hypothetical protein [Steroidobacteraceae bacterium]